MALFGAWRGATSGDYSGGRRASASIARPADAVRLGIGLIAQDRRDGLSGEHSIYDNAILADLAALMPARLRRSAWQRGARSSTCSRG